MIILDTDICIELLKGNKRVIQHREEHDDAVGISFMSVAELYYGAEKSSNPLKNQATVEEFLLSLEIVQSDLPILRRFGALKAMLQKAGIALADADLLIGATAIEKGAPHHWKPEAF